jgi:hypothetical protein
MNMFANAMKSAERTNIVQIMLFQSRRHSLSF